MTKKGQLRNSPFARKLLVVSPNTVVVGAVGYVLLFIITPNWPTPDKLLVLMTFIVALIYPACIHLGTVYHKEYYFVDELIGSADVIGSCKLVTVYAPRFRRLTRVGLKRLYA